MKKLVFSDTSRKELESVKSRYSEEIVEEVLEYCRENGWEDYEENIYIEEGEIYVDKETVVEGTLEAADEFEKRDGKWVVTF